MRLKIDYIPVPSGRKFHASPARVKLAVGGKRSSKTLTMLEEALMLSFEYPGNVGLLARETYGEAQEALIDPMLKIVPNEVIEYTPTIARKALKFTNGSVIYFRGLDEHRKSKGLTLGFVGIDEVDAVTEEDLIQLDGQISLFGARPVLMATCNPVERSHWVYRRWVTDQLPGYEYFRFPTRDNASHLPAGYIEHMLGTMPESWVKRYLEGEWGSITLGDRVYEEFSEKLHIYPALVTNVSMPVRRTWDFGAHAAVTFSQLRDKMGMDYLGEVFRRKLTAQQFAQVVGKISKEYFPGAVFADRGDIAGLHNETTSGMSAIDVVNKELGISINYSKIPLADSIELVRTKLSQIISGITALRFHPRMRLTIEALNGGYVWQKNRDGTVQKGIPAADDTFEHLMDTMRYDVWDAFAYDRNRRDAEDGNTIEPVESVWDGVSW